MKRIFNPVKKKTIVMVHDDDLVAQVYRDQLQSAGLRVEIACNGDSTMQILERNAVALVLLDLSLTGTSGIEVLETIRGQFPSLPVIVFFNPFLVNPERTAMKAGAIKSVVKTATPPCKMPALIQTFLPDADRCSIDQKNPGLTNSAGIASATNKIPEVLAHLRAYYQVLTRTELDVLRRSDFGKLRRETEFDHALDASKHRPGHRYCQCSLASVRSSAQRSSVTSDSGRG
jgi:DNA-binding NtrC family response regulator